ncbi:molybdopterin-dependent oxidoreductase [Chloroflexota bacterium]
MKRVPGTKRGEGKFTRISWDEALNTIAGKMKEIREKYGPYSIMTHYHNDAAERLFSLWGAGVDGWGACSYDAARLMSHLIVGEKGWDVARWSSGSAADMLANTRIIVLWGSDPTVGHQGPAHMFAWFIKLARERGIHVIIVDARYSVAVSTLADQWIPIKPGIDSAMFMAMAYVLFQEDLWNREFVTKYLEPVGFERWRNYILGTEDGIAKTPVWAESRCAVPAETIRELARMVGTIKPAWLWSHWSVSRKSNGEQTVGAFTALQAMLGSWGDPGAGLSMQPGPYRPLPLGEVGVIVGQSGDYKVPHLYRSHYWAEAVLLLDKVRSGELSEADYMRMVGWKADASYLDGFNPKFFFWGGNIRPHSSNSVVTVCDSSNNQVKAFEKMEFVVTTHSISLVDVLPEIESSFDVRLETGLNKAQNLCFRWSSTLGYRIDMKGVLIRVGIDSTLGGWNSPVDPITRDFVYVPIPEEEKDCPVHPEYAVDYSQFKIPCENLGVNFPQRLLSKNAHLDPDFEYLTYGDRKSRGKPLFSLIEGDIVAFFSSNVTNETVLP